MNIAPKVKYIKNKILNVKNSVSATKKSSNFNRNLMFFTVAALTLWMSSALIFPSTKTSIQQQLLYKKPNYVVMNSSAQNFTRTIDLYGITSAFIIEIKGVIEGIVDKKHVKNGDLVNKGDVLLEIHKPDLPIQIQQAEALVKATEIDLESSRSLFDDKLLSERELYSKEERFLAAKAQLESLRERQSYVRILAPEAGYVSNIMVEEGDYIQTFQAQDLMHIVRPTPMLATVHIPEVYSNSLNFIETADIYFASSKNPQKATVYSISPEANASTKTFEAKFSYNKNSVIIGETVSVSIPISEEKAHLVPISAVKLLDDGSLAVNVVSELLEEDSEEGFITKQIEILKDSNKGLWVTGPQLSSEEKFIILEHLPI